MLTVSHPPYSICFRFRIGAIFSWATIGACLIGRILSTNIFSPQRVESWLACKGSALVGSLSLEHGLLSGAERPGGWCGGSRGDEWSSQLAGY